MYDCISFSNGGRRGRDRMVVGFTTYLCTQYLSPLTLWVRTPLRRDVLDTTLWPLRSNWNIVESGVKQHNPNPNPYPRTLFFFKPRKLISQNLNELTNSILNICNFFFSQNIILQLIQVHRETDLMETMEVKYFRKTLYPTTL
jgi:hypothetical protein